MFAYKYIRTRNRMYQKLRVYYIGLHMRVNGLIRIISREY